MSYKFEELLKISPDKISELCTENSYENKLFNWFYKYDYKNYTYTKLRVYYILNTDGTPTIYWFDNIANIKVGIRVNNNEEICYLDLHQYRYYFATYHLWGVSQNYETKLFSEEFFIQILISEVEKLNKIYCLDFYYNFEINIQDLIMDKDKWHYTLTVDKILTQKRVTKPNLSNMQLVNWDAEKSSYKR